VNSSVIFTDQHAPDGRTIRYNVDIPTPQAAALVEEHLNAGTLVPIPNESGGDPIFVNPERVASVAPSHKED